MGRIRMEIRPISSVLFLRNKSVYLLFVDLESELDETGEV